MGFLGASRLSSISSKLMVFRAVSGFNVIAGLSKGLTAQVHRVGTHIGDVTTLVQLLRNCHGGAGAKAQLSVSILLQGAGGERRQRFASASGLVDIGDGKSGVA